MVAQRRAALYQWVSQRQEGKIPEVSKYLLERVKDKNMPTDKDPWLEPTPLERITALENERQILNLQEHLTTAERARLVEIGKELPGLWDLHRRGKAALKVHPKIRASLPKQLAGEQAYTGDEFDNRRGPRLKQDGTMRYCPNCKCKRNSLKVKKQAKTYGCRYCGHTFTQE
jgi:hypothetical protein